MNKTAVELLRTNASYIDALKEAIDRWEKSNDTDEKRDLLVTIGEIGVDVHNRNRQLGIRYPDDGETDEADLNQKRIDEIESAPSWRAIY